MYVKSYVYGNLLYTSNRSLMYLVVLKVPEVGHLDLFYCQKYRLIDYLIHKPVTQFWEALKSLEGGALLEKVCHYGTTLNVLVPTLQVWSLLPKCGSKYDILILPSYCHAFSHRYGFCICKFNPKWTLSLIYCHW